MFKHNSHGQVFLLDSYLRYYWQGQQPLSISHALWASNRLRQSLPVTLHMKG